MTYMDSTTIQKDRMEAVRSLMRARNVLVERIEAALAADDLPRLSWYDVLLELNAAPERRVSALVYLIDRGHRQYAGRLDVARQLHLVRQGHGQSGPNRDYVLSTVHALEALGLYDRDLHLLAEKLQAGHEKRV